MVMGQIMSLTNTSHLTVHSTKHRHNDKVREHHQATYYHQGLQICRKMFLFLHNLKPGMFKALRKSCRENGLVTRVHGNTRRLPVHALTFDEVSHVVSFIKNYAEDHTIPLPGRIPGFKRADLQVLPCSTTRRLVWEKYNNVTSSADQSSTSQVIRAVSYSSFTSIWRKFLPMILPSRPQTDLCSTCYHNAGLLMWSGNLSEAEKSEVTCTNL